MGDKPTLLDENGNVLNGNGMPWWFKAGYLFGIPAAIAAFLVWYVTLGPGGDRNDMRALQSSTQTLMIQMSQHMSSTEALNRNIEYYMQVQTLLTRQLCVNASSSQQERDACFAP